MAQPNKSRPNRRSSSSTSFASTLTPLLFVALCVLGIWMLTSNSVVSPKTRTAIDTDSATTNDDLSSSAEDTASTSTSTDTSTNTIEVSPETTTKSQDQKDTTIYGDNPGNLPDDAIKNDDRRKQESVSQVPEENTSTPKQEVAVTKEVAGSDNDQKINEFEKELQSTQVSEGNQKAEEENTTAQEETPNTNVIANANPNVNSEQSTASQDANANANSEQNTASQDANANANSEQNTASQDANADANSDANSEQNTASQDAKANANSEQNTASQEANTNANSEQNTAYQDAKVNSNSEQNMASKDANAVEIQEENAGGEQGSKNSYDEANAQQLREDKGEVTEKDQKQRLEDESGETEKEKAEKKRRKKESKKSWSTQADESRGEKERQNEESKVQLQTLKWSLCNVTAGVDYIPCLDNEKYLKTSHRKHFEHRERHCPEDAPTCLVPCPKGYKTPIHWPSSRDKIWYHNIPNTLLAEVKGHQNWVKKTGEFLTFPGGGTQFIHGALHYIDFLEQARPDIAWGKHTRVILDVGCGVGSFGGYLFERDVIAMSFAPKDEHEAQVQFALERGIPAISAVMGTQRLQFPSGVFDLIHCARCRVPWHEDGGMLLLELNRLLRPGGYFVWCATPVYQTIEEDAEIWKQMTSLTKSICWELVTIKKDKLNQVGAAFYRKPTSNECYERREQTQPPMCKDDDDPNAAWYVPLQACMNKLHVEEAERGNRWPEPWPRRLQKAPYWLNSLQGGKQASQDFAADNDRWQNVVDELSNIGVTWSNVRNVMDMRATYGGFAAALKDLPVWVFNVVNIDSPDTLSVIYERGLIGMYHDWCESFSTYPRTYDLLHADRLFSILKNRCNLVPVIAEVDRIVRPGGSLVVRDESSAIGEVENMLTSLHWKITSKNQEGVLCAKKGKWRPNS